jgi:hypothetical protein
MLTLIIITSVFVGRQLESEDDGEGERILRLAQTLLFHLCDDLSQAPSSPL